MIDRLVRYPKYTFARGVSQFAAAGPLLESYAQSSARVNAQGVSSLALEESTQETPAMRLLAICSKAFGRLA